MTSTQMDLFAPRAVSRAEPDELAARLLVYLERAGGWRTREDVRRDVGFTDRETRLARQASDGAIIYGQRGFRATACATVEEIAACANTLESQAREMTAQAIRLRNRAHRRIA